MKTESRSTLVAKVFAFILFVFSLNTVSTLSQPNLHFGVEGNPWTVWFPKVQVTFGVDCPSGRVDFTKDNFTIKDNGQVITNFTLEKSCHNLLLILDRSLNMSGSKLSQAKATAKGLVELLDPTCQSVMIMSISDTLIVNTNFISDKNILKTTIDGITANGNHALWDNLYTVIDTLVWLGMGFPDMVIVLTDGFDNASLTHDVNDCGNLAYQYGAQIYPVGFGNPVNQVDLKKLADLTAGIYYYSPQNCSDYSKIFVPLVLSSDNVKYRIIYDAPLCPETYKHVIELTVGLPSSLYCCQGTATKTIEYTPRYRNQNINIGLDTVTVLAKQRGVIHLMLNDSIDGEFIRSTFKMKFDTSLCRFIDISTAGGLLQGKIISFQRAGDSLFFTLNESTCIKGKGLLASLTFETKDPQNDVDCILELVDWIFAHGRFTAKTSNGLIRILSHWLNLSSPNGGESYCVGDNANIEWTQSRVDTVNIHLSRDGGKYYSPLATNALSSPFTWTIPTDQTPGINYRIRIREKDGDLIDTSKNNFTINIPPLITIQPQNKTVCEGQNVIFYSFAVSYPLPAVQWQRSTDKGASWDDLIGENNDSLRLLNVDRASIHESRYRAYFTNACGNGTSDEAVLNVNSFPLVATHPHDTIICEGATLYLASYASGFPAPKSQWQIAPENGTTWTDIAGETTDTLKLANIKRGAFNYQYRNVFTNDCGDATSNPAVVRVGDPLSITSQPQPKTQTICIGQKIIFSVQAIGSNVKYQWLRNGNILSGKNTSTLTIDSCTINDDGYYVASITGDCSNGIASDSVFVNVNYPTIITSHPKNLTVCQGTDAIFRIASISKPQANIQWQVSTDNGKTFTDLVGENNDSLKIKNIQIISNGNQYRTVLNNSCGSVATQPAILLVNSKSPTITSQPQDQNICEGSMATFNVTSYDATSYQWRKNGVYVPGETASTFTINNVKSSDAGLFDAIVLNTCGQIISASARLSVKFPIQIVTHPVSQTVKENSSVTFQSSVVGTNPTFQWLKNGNPISNATDSILTIASVKKSDEGDYTVRVNGTCGNPVTSNIAKLLVTVVSVNDNVLIPAETKLFQNYPNPFSEQTEIRYNLSASDHVIVQVFDLLGRFITTVVDEHQNAGFHKVEFDLHTTSVIDGYSLQTGIYVYRLTTKNKSFTRTMAVIK